ncbi:MAG: class I SAM-dependent methyltransferase [Acidimicrobiales bacterium]
MDKWLEANRANWNDRVGIHVKSRFYDVEGWLRDETVPTSLELQALGNVEGLTLVHLQCHFGMDTLRWARVGATVTGVDFSPAAIAEATNLAERAQLEVQSRFVCATVYDAPEALAGERFDVVYVSLGSLCWLPSIDMWARSVAKLLRPAGRLYLHDVHPLSNSLDDDGERFTFGYFEAPEPFIFDSTETYTDGDGIASTTTYEWNHSLAEIFGALHSNGVVVDAFDELDWTVWRQFPWLEESEMGTWTIPAERTRIPLAFTLVAHLAG